MKCRDGFSAGRLLLLALAFAAAFAHGQEALSMSADKVYAKVKEQLGRGVLLSHPMHYIFLINTSQGANANNPASLTNAAGFVSEFCKAAQADESQFTVETQSNVSIRAYQNDLYPGADGDPASLNDVARLAAAVIVFHPQNGDNSSYPAIGGGHIDIGPRSQLLAGVGTQNGGRMNLVIQITPNPVSQPPSHGDAELVQGRNSATEGIGVHGFRALDQEAFSWDAGSEGKTKEYYCWVYAPDPIPVSGLATRSQAPLLGSAVEKKPKFQPREVPVTAKVQTGDTGEGAGLLVAGVAVLLLISSGAYWCLMGSTVVIDGGSYSLRRFGVIKITGESTGASKGGLRYVIPPGKLMEKRPGTIAEIRYGLADPSPVLCSQGVELDAGGKRGRTICLKVDRDVPVTFKSVTGTGGMSNIATIIIKIGKPKLG